MSTIKQTLAIVNKINTNRILLRSISSLSCRNFDFKRYVPESTKTPLLKVTECSIDLKNSFASQVAEDVKKRITTLVKNKPVVLFIKGNIGLINIFFFNLRIVFKF